MTKKVFIVFSVVFATVVCASAQTNLSKVPARRDSIQAEQPNGERLWIYLIGDEWQHKNYTTDGFLLKANKKNFLCYAKLNKYGEIVPSTRKAKNKNERSKRDWKWLKKIEGNEQLHRTINF